MQGAVKKEKPFFDTANPQEVRLLEPMKDVYLSPKIVTLFLLKITAFLFIAHVISLFFERLLPAKSTLRRMTLQYFHLDSEASFPTFFSAILLLLSSIILFLIYKRDRQEKNKKNVKYWLTLSILFLFLSVDEAIQIHERTMAATHKMISDLPNILASAWVIPYSIFFLIVVGFFLKFIFRLPVKTRNLFILSAFIYVFAALVLELPESYFRKEYGSTHVYYSSIITLQEVLEMTGIIIFIYALLDYISFQFRNLMVSIG